MCIKIAKTSHFWSIEIEIEIKIEIDTDIDIDDRYCARRSRPSIFGRPLKIRDRRFVLIVSKNGSPSGSETISNTAGFIPVVVDRLARSGLVSNETPEVICEFSSRVPF